MTSPADNAVSDAPLDAETITHFEKRLLEDRKRAVQELARFDATNGASQEDDTGELSTYRFHLADVGTETMEQEKNHLLASHTGRLVVHIDDALRRLYRSPETFGRCHDCGRAIAYDRLDALPNARFCIQCKQRAENGNEPG
jgi:RNA polymerase-binding transcription factor DksA